MIKLSGERAGWLEGWLIGWRLAGWLRLPIAGCGFAVGFVAGISETK